MHSFERACHPLSGLSPLAQAVKRWSQWSGLNSQCPNSDRGLIGNPRQSSELILTRTIPFRTRLLKVSLKIWGRGRDNRDRQVVEDPPSQPAKSEDAIVVLISAIEPSHEVERVAKNDLHGHEWPWT
jgi:hypothetical protein